MNFASKNSPVSGALAGKTAIIAASDKLLRELTIGLRALGAEAIPVAVLEAKEIEDNEALNVAITNIGKYDWIIFTSAWGVSFFAKRLARVSAVSGSGIADGLPKVCAIGRATAEAAEKHGFPITITADEFNAEGVMQSIERYHGGAQNLRGLNVLIPRALEARDFLPAALTSTGCRVDTIPCYQTVRPQPDAEISARLRQLLNETPDLIVFTSAKALLNFLKTAAETAGETAARRCIREAIIAVIGPVTAAALEAEGESAEIIPHESAVPSLLAAIAAYFS